MDKLKNTFQAWEPDRWCGVLYDEEMMSQDAGELPYIFTAHEFAVRAIMHIMENKDD